MTTTDHPLTETAAADPSEPLARTLLGVPEGHGAPHHDAGAIRAGDFVMQVDKDGSIRAGIAHYQDAFGEWRTRDGRTLIWIDASADRPDAVTAWPAPTPPAEEITLPTEHPAHITDVEDAYGDVCAYMARSKCGVWVGVDQDGDIRNWVPGAITAFTLPDGTRALYEGIRADGTPRFVKEDDQ